MGSIIKRIKIYSKKSSKIIRCVHYASATNIVRPNMVFKLSLLPPS